MIDDPMVTMTHLREIQYCARGLRTWFVRQHLDWGEFLKSGLPASVLEATGDAMALRAAAYARDQAAQAAEAGDARG